MESGKLSPASRPTIFRELLNPEGKDDEYVVPTVDQLKDEAHSLLAAAADTTGNAMSTAAYYVVSNSKIYSRLRKELEDAFPDPERELSFVELEKLPYLVSVPDVEKLLANGK